jgi:hypothetical protein
MDVGKVKYWEKDDLKYSIQQIKDQGFIRNLSCVVLKSCEIFVLRRVMLLKILSVLVHAIQTIPVTYVP